MCALSSLAHIIGVSVSETTADTRMVTRKRDREFAEQAANDVTHEQQWYQHGDERNGQRNDGKTDLPGAFQRRIQGESPFFQKRSMFSIITMASSTTKPVEMVSAINVRLLRL